MKARNVRRLGAAGLLLAVLVMSVSNAGAAPAQNITISDAEVTEGGKAVFKVSLTAGKDNSVVTYVTKDGSATVADLDYEAKQGSVTVEAGKPPVEIEVQTVQDAKNETDETFTVELTAATNQATIEDGVGAGKILNNDAPPTIASISDPTVTEGNAGTVNASFVVTLSAPSGKDITVQYATAEGTATANEDFIPASGTLTIAAGATTGTINVQVKGDTLPEPDEHFFINLFGAVNAESIVDAQGKATITNDDTPPSIASISDPTVTEGNTGTVAANFEVRLSGNAPSPVTIRYSTRDGSAVAPDDYTAVPPNSPVTIPAGSDRVVIPVQVKGDTLPEPNEDFFLTILSVTNATMGSDNEGKATIVNDDAAPTISIQSASVTEGDGGTVSLSFTVRLSTRTAQQVQVTATTQDGTAVAPSDYQSRTQVLVWAPNTAELDKTFTVLVNGDTLDETNETLHVQLSSPSGATIAGGSAVGTIIDNDNNSRLAISNAEANEGAAGVNSTMTFKVTLAPASARPVSVAWATADGTATAGSDYTAASGTLTFAPGETEKAIVVSVLGDDINEENETVQVKLSDASGAAVADADGLGTIVDKNAPPSLSIDDPSAREGEGATFTVTLAGTTLRTVTVTFTTEEGMAQAGSDFAPRRGTLTFAPGEKTKTVSVTVIDDTLGEGPETFSVNLGDPVNAVMTKASGFATIEASDLDSLSGPSGPPPARDLPVTRGLPLAPKSTNRKVVFPQMVLGPRSLTLTSVGRARMQVTCTKKSRVTCSGSVLLQNPSKPMFVLGKRTFSVKRGKQAYIPVTLNDRGFALVQKRGSLRARAVVFIKAGGKTYRFVPGYILIRAAKNPQPRVAVDK